MWIYRARAGDVIRSRDGHLSVTLDGKILQIAHVEIQARVRFGSPVKLRKRHNGDFTSGVQLNESVRLGVGGKKSVAFHVSC